jgi:hypothetical protein
MDAGVAMFEFDEEMLKRIREEMGKGQPLKFDEAVMSDGCIHLLHKGNVVAMMSAKQYEKMIGAKDAISGIGPGDHRAGHDFVRGDGSRRSPVGH